MINSTVTRKISAVFLATVLVAGIISLVSPSFMVGAQAVPEYGMDSYDKKAYGKDKSYKSKDSSSVSIKKVKCNNINVNVNGLELNILPPFLSNLLASEAQASDEGERGASSYGSGSGGYDGEKSRSDGDFKFVCINNNNNTVVEVPPVPPVPVNCDDCFEVKRGQEGIIPQGLLNQLNEFLETNEVTVGEGLDSTGIVGDVEGLCDAIEREFGQGTPATEEQIRDILDAGFAEGPVPPDVATLIDTIIECLLSLSPSPITPTV